MHKTKDQLYDLVKDLKNKKEYEDEINARFLKCNKILNKDTIALLLVDELGRNKQVFSKISELQPNSEYTIVGTITHIYDSKSFKRKNGTRGKVINLIISDDSASCRLVLWNKDVEQVLNKKITIGSTIKIINGYTKNGYNGLEINVGRWGMFDVASDTQYMHTSNQQHNLEYIEGVLTHKEPTKPFFKDDGEFGFVTNIILKHKEKEIFLTLWDSKVKDIQRFTIGDYIRIKNFTKKQNNGSEEFHVNSNAVIEKR
jgi:replication factor A1